MILIMLTIRKLECGAYRVHHMFTNYSDQMYETLNKALDLCRLRCNTTLKENNLTVVETIVPISARLIANKAGYQFKGDRIDELAQKLSQQMEA